MTCKEKLAIEHPGMIDNTCLAGCRGCPHDYGYMPNYDCDGVKCTDCWNREIPNKEPSDIHKLIDDAMEKKDREVSIFIMKDSTSVYVRPVGFSDPRWITIGFDKDRYFHRSFMCSECKAISEDLTPFCPHCGEKLRMPTMDDKEIKCDSEDSAKEARDE